MKIVVMGGSFNPPTTAHLRLLQTAVQAIDADQGIFVPVGDRYLRNKMKKKGLEHQALPSDLRYRMLLAMTKDDPKLTVDDREFYDVEKKYTYDTMVSIQKDYPDDTLYFLAGNDKLSILPRWNNISLLLKEFSVIVCRRDDEDPEDTIAANGFFDPYRDHLMIIDPPEGIEKISATAVRDALEQNQAAAEAMCHPEAWRLLVRYHQTIRSLQEEYRFLSNFWEAPVTYEGLTYPNNEAAFQAQKCLSREEKLPFTNAPASLAKSMGRQVKLRPDWEDIKVRIMEEIVRAKFTQNHDLKRLLLATEDRMIEEGNTWHDTFWGVDARTRKGHNHLGKILMKVREELKNS